MSRFSKKEAENLGWKFYHESDEVVLRDGDNEQGISKKVPPSIRAEKMIDLPGSDLFRTTEEAPTIGLLLERIHSFEEHLKARLDAPDSEADARPLDEEPNPDKQKEKQLEENERVAEAPEPGEVLDVEPGLAESIDLEPQIIKHPLHEAKPKRRRLRRRSS